MNSILLAFALAASSFAQVTPFPGALDSNATLGVAADNVQSALTAPMQIGDTTAQVANATRIPQWSLITFGAEIARVCLKSGNTLTFGTASACPSIAGRGLSGTTVAPHSTGVIGHLNINAYHQLAAASAIMAIEGSIPPMVSDVSYKAAGNTFYQACAAAAGFGMQLAVSSQWTGVAAGSCPATLQFMAGGKIRPGAGQTATLSGSLIAPANGMFDYSGGGAINLAGDARITMRLEYGGAVGDGSTNDSIAANGIIATAKTSNVPIELMGKNYRVNTATSGVLLNILNGQIGMTIHGAGSQLTQISTTTAGADLIAAISNTGGNATFNLSGFAMIGPDAITSNPSCGSTTSSGNGLRLSGSTTTILNLKDVTATGFCGGGKAGFDLENFENSIVENVAANYNQIGFYMAIPAADTFNFLSAGANRTYGIQTSGGNSNVFNSVAVQSNDGLGWYQQGSWVSTTINALHCENNNRALSGVAGCVYMDSTLGAIVGNICNSCSMNGSRENWKMTQVAPNGIYGNIFQGGITNSGATGVKVIESGAVSSNVFMGFITDLTQISFTGENRDVFGPVPTGNVNYQPGLWANAATLNAVTWAVINTWGGRSTGTLAFITDATVNTWGAAVTEGGGTNNVLVVFDGTNWTVAGK